MSSTASISGAQQQLNAFGTQNLVISTKQPHATLWRNEHVPLTHFAYADVRSEFSGTVSFGSRVVCELDRPADLMSEVNFRYTLRAWTENAGVAGTFPETDPDNNYFYTDDIGNAMIQLYELSVGNNRFDVADGTYFHIYDEECKAEGRQTGAETGKFGSRLARVRHARFDQDLIVPIPTDLLVHPGKAIESIAIHKQKVRMNFTLRPLAELIRTTGTGTTAYDLGLANPADANAVLANGGSNVLQDAHLQVHYVWVTEGERLRMLSRASVTLYREIQTATEIQKASADTLVRQRMAFNNAACDYFFVVRLNSKWDIESADATQRGYEWFDFSGVNTTLGGVPAVVHANYPFLTHTLSINNAQRISATSQYLDSWIGQNHYPRGSRQGIHKVPFARHPADEHPTGSLNFSMIDHQDFSWTFDAALTGAAVILLYVRAWQVAVRRNGVLHKEFQSQ